MDPTYSETFDIAKRHAASEATKIVWNMFFTFGESCFSETYRDEFKSFEIPMIY